MIKYIILLLNLFLSVLLLFQDSVFVIGEFHLYGLLIIMIFNYFEQRTITLLQVWLLAFVFIIVSESILIEPVSRTIEAVKFLFFANNLIVFGYYLSFLKFNSKQTTRSLSIKPSKYFIHIIIIFLLFDDLDNNAGPNCSATFSDSKFHFFFHCYRSDELNG